MLGELIVDKITKEEVKYLLLVDSSLATQVDEPERINSVIVLPFIDQPLLM
jgi:hypothetical protein